jgi:hypothetical protein
MFNEIDQLTLWEANDLFTYWSDYPPTHVLVGAYLLGAKTARRSRSKSQDFDELCQAIRATGGTCGNKLPAAYKQ